MSDSVLDRIRQNRQRPAVATRDDSLITGVQPVDTDISTDTQIFEDVLDSERSTQSISDNTQDTLDELKAELDKIPKTNRHSAIVLEKEVDQVLTRYCKENRITIEVFLEAAWIYASSNPSTMKKIVTEAKHRYDDRKRAGKLRRLITMIESRPTAKPNK
jgi:hypothetical protein